jgi:hypothetical protein
MEEMAGSERNQRKQGSLQDLIGRNEHQPFVVASVSGEDAKGGADHVLFGERAWAE